MVIAPDLAVATQHELGHMRSSLETRLEKDGIRTKSPRARRRRHRARARRRRAGAAVRELLGGDFDALRGEETAPGVLRDPALGRLGEAGPRARDGPDARGDPAPRRRPGDRHPGVGRDAAGRLAHPGADPGRLGRARDIFKQTGLPRVQDRARLRRERERRGAPAREVPADGLPPGHRDRCSRRTRKTKQVLGAYLVPRRAGHHRRVPRRTRASSSTRRRSEWQVAFTVERRGRARSSATLTGKNVGQAARDRPRQPGLLARRSSATASRARA